MKIEITKFEVGLLSMLALYFLFVATNVNQTLGLTYGIFSLAVLLFIVIDPKRTIHLKKESDSFLGSFFVGAVGYVVLVIIGTYVLVPGVAKIADLINLLGTTTPALAQSNFLNFVSFAIAVPIAETYIFFIAFFDIAASLVGIDINKHNLTRWKLWAIILFISFLFMAFHFTAKGITNLPVLTLVFFMAIISLVLVTYYREGQQAVWFHIIANTVPSLSLFMIILPALIV